MKHIIVGAGINGLFTAYYLMQAGEKVVLIDQGDVGRESSWAGGGILSPLYPWRYPDAVTHIASWSQQRYPALVSELHSQTGIDPEYLQSGLLMLDPRESKQATIWAEKYKHSIKLLNKEMCQQISDEIRLAYDGGMLMKNVGQVRNPRLVKALQISLIAGGTTILKYEKCTKIIRKGHRVTGIVTDKQQHMADSVCLCCGAWTKSLLQGTSNIPTIEPVKGQMLLLQSRPNLINHIVLGETHYIIPRKDGLILVGSTLEHVGYDKTTTQEAREILTAAAYALIPGLRDAKIIQQWAGLRPGSKNGIPTICGHPELKGLYINSGQYRNGVVMAPGSGTLMADLILQKPSFVDPAAYNLASIKENIAV
ncbi:MAG: glycine oxidase ThiO [Thiohalomonadales bacterium]